MTRARKAALLRLLKDWEAGRTTDDNSFSSDEWQEVRNMRKEYLVASVIGNDWWTLPPAGLAAARQAREEQSHG